MRVAFRRKNIRLQPSNYCGRRLYFLTLCFHHRRRFGSNPRLASWLIAKLSEHATATQFLVHAYCVMPDHMHFLTAAESDTANMMAFVESFKKDTGFRFEERTGHRLWQFKYYDRILRASDRAESVAWYIWMNPVRQGVCSIPTEYPFLGTFTDVGRKFLARAMPPDWIPPWKRQDLSLRRVAPR
jgi:putative transposase